MGEPVRVIAGSLRHRRLRRPPKGVRPTSDRVREALFASLGSLEGRRFLDLYAGTGAVGIEAVSRGATEVVFVERSRQSLEVLRDNLADLGVESGVRVLEGDAGVHLSQFRERGETFDLVFVDPPYDSDEASRILKTLRRAGTVNSGGQVVVESAKRNPLACLAGWEVDAEHDYGDSRLTRLVGEVRGPGAPDGDGPADNVPAREFRKPDVER
ncbi:MAG: 16S rRNA (guanine(966)-N(2))-methyltransferase RsmD [Myxococcota bacterium]